MEKKGIVAGQRVNPLKIELAKEFRKHLTVTERMLWNRLRAGRFGGRHFRRQQIIDGFIVDFYCHESGLVVEIDGSVHREQAEYDAERDIVLSARGLHILRFTNEEIEQNITAVLVLQP